MSQNDDQILSPGFKARMRIISALDTLCEVKPFSRITTDDISKQAGISHSSFYHYFSDKNAAVQWYSFLCYEVGIDQTGRTLSWYEAHLMTTKCFEKYRSLFIGGAQSTEYSAGQPSFIRHRQENLRETITEYKHLELTSKLAAQIEALAYGECAISVKYLQRQYDFSLREYCDLMTTLVPQELFVLLDTPVSDGEHKGNFFLFSNNLFM